MKRRARARKAQPRAQKKTARKAPAVGGGKKPVQPYAVTPSKPQKPSTKRPVIGRVIPDQSLWAQFQRIGGGLTPLDVSSIIREADTGYLWRLCDLANEARQKDCHLQSVLGTNEETIAGLAWELVLPEKATKREKKVATWVESVLRQNMGLPRLFAHHAGSVFFGYAVSETDWQKNEGKLVPAGFERHPPRRFAFDQVTGKFIWRDWNQPNKGVDFREEFPNKFIVSQPRVTGDVPVREGLIRVLMWAALFRNWTLSDWLKLGEIAWKPWRTATYSTKDTPKGRKASQEDIDNLTAILEGMSSNGVAVYPDSSDLKVQWAQGSGGGTGKSTHSSMFAVTAAEMSKCVLGQTETTEASDSSGYAQAKVHNEVRKDLRDARAKSVAADVTRDLIAVMVRLNYGTGIRPPHLRFITEDVADLGKFAEAVKTLSDPAVKLRMGATWARKQAGIPEPEKGEELVGPPKGEEPPDPTAPASPTLEPEMDGDGVDGKIPTGDEGGDAEGSDDGGGGGD